ncbi:MAG: transcription termination/antitermination factor NusG [Candidatus Schekmanbacteria bacterium RBG_16_38_11]|uniref:Transcription termination/antitermination protein NusG n=1 Tax=Candidatus Schekmanbacteria bacterium RBG_16_38_11 TaxID=1817880 RepID=A0A1F7RT07_9BACT|nr:MAG: transcription termination/antitermination factor NusG [Candidatus Schekmanbacteria bacterium RBG_16_38_11]
MAKKWYVVHTYSGFENKVKAAIEELVKKQHFEEKIFRVLVPSENVTNLRKGVKVVTSRKFFPGYVLIEMELDEDTWHIIKNVPKVTGFLGGSKTPASLREEEIDKILNQEVAGVSRSKLKDRFTKGEAVRIIDGPFENFTGVVEEVNMEKERVKVMVSIFGRSTPVEFEFLQVDKIT